jgi:hypothetical protein
MVRLKWSVHALLAHKKMVNGKLPALSHYRPPHTLRTHHPSSPISHRKDERVIYRAGLRRRHRNRIRQHHKLDRVYLSCMFVCMEWKGRCVADLQVDRMERRNLLRTRRVTDISHRFCPTSIPMSSTEGRRRHSL